MGALSHKARHTDGQWHGRGRSVGRGLAAAADRISTTPCQRVASRSPANHFAGQPKRHDAVTGARPAIRTASELAWCRGALGHVAAARGLSQEVGNRSCMRASQRGTVCESADVADRAQGHPSASRLGGGKGEPRAKWLKSPQAVCSRASHVPAHQAGEDEAGPRSLAAPAELAEGLQDPTDPTLARLVHGPGRSSTAPYGPASPVWSPFVEVPIPTLPMHAAIAASTATVVNPAATAGRC